MKVQITVNAEKIADAHNLKNLIREVMGDRMVECAIYQHETEKKEMITGFWEFMDVSQNKKNSVLLSSIYYFEYLKKQRKVRIFTENGEYTLRETMCILEEKLNSFGFILSCRGLLVNLKHVVKVNRNSVLLDSGINLPLSQRRVSDFKRSYREQILNLK